MKYNHLNESCNAKKTLSFAVCVAFPSYREKQSVHVNQSFGLFATSTLAHGIGTGIGIGVGIFSDNVDENQSTTNHHKPSRRVRLIECRRVLAKNAP